MKMGRGPQLFARESATRFVAKVEADGQHPDVPKAAITALADSTHRHLSGAIGKKLWPVHRRNTEFGAGAGVVADEVSKKISRGILSALVEYLVDAIELSRFSPRKRRRVLRARQLTQELRQKGEGK